MAMHQKTTDMIASMKNILVQENPMTVRQVYYQLVSQYGLENNIANYGRVSRTLVQARELGLIPWEWIEDRLRKPRTPAMWQGLPDFADACERSYRRNVWNTQPAYFEIWLEKDALSGIFEDSLEYYGVTLNVGRGYDSASSAKNAATRYRNIGGDVTVLYFGDFDPSGEDMPRSLVSRLEEYGAPPVRLVKCALTRDDIEQYQLPTAFAKKSDTRSRRFIEEHGDISVELDALHIDVLRRRLVENVEAMMDMVALEETLRCESEEREYIVRQLSDR